jgi:hypothetical protein
LDNTYRLKVLFGILYLGFLLLTNSTVGNLATEIRYDVTTRRILHIHYSMQIKGVDLNETQMLPHVVNLCKKNRS